MKILVTGASGFVGRWVCLDLLARGHEVVGAVRTAEPLPAWGMGLPRLSWQLMELEDRATIHEALATRPDAIIHLAALASGAEARRAPMLAWRINCLGTAELIYALEQSGQRPRFVFASTGEVYGAGHERPIPEDAPTLPCSPYAASKLGAEVLLLESHRRAKLDLVIARSFAQTGPGQRAAFVVPALADRLVVARQAGEHTIRVGNLAPVREFVDVRDVAGALWHLLERAPAGSVYNIARGEGQSLRHVVDVLSDAIDWPTETKADPDLFRAADIDYLVGDGSRLAALGWQPEWTLDRTLQEVALEALAARGHKDWSKSKA